MPGKPKDITNQRFGRLTAIRNLGKMPGDTVYTWECQCDCGNTINIKIGSLTSGNTKSCGCLKKDALTLRNQKNSDAGKISPGTKIQKLTIIKDIGYREQVPGHSRIWYLCECECGNIVEVMGNRLKSGNTGSCGKCNFNSKGEFQIHQLLTSHNYSFLHDVIFQPLVAETGRKLRFDFIVYKDDTYTEPELFIEFDGRQHVYGPDTSYWGHTTDTLESIKERDNIKNQFCLNHGYKLVRIPYWKVGEKISLEDILGDKYQVKKEKN